MCIWFPFPFTQNAQVSDCTSAGVVYHQCYWFPGPANVWQNCSEVKINQKSWSTNLLSNDFFVHQIDHILYDHHCVCGYPWNYSGDDHSAWKCGLHRKESREQAAHGTDSGHLIGFN